MIARKRVDNLWTLPCYPHGMESTPTNYLSYLVRLWQDDPAGTTRPWRAEIEHIQTGARLQFRTLEELWGYLQRQTLQRDANDTNLPENS